uniref:Putative LOC100202460 [Hydra vulgaris] n=1 Tax=Lepeophtheirus salmonis TaxID=72036 RepID=A0A0K2T7M4_LEPSM
MTKKECIEGVTPDTFTAAYRTAIGLSELCKYLLDIKGVQYIILQKINSDPIERRFGWYRQLGGGNYHICIRQFVEAEKNIRLSLLLKSETKSLGNLKDIFRGEDEKGSRFQDVNKMLSLIPSDCFLDLQFSSGIEGGIYYLSGYSTHSLIKSLKRNCCATFLSASGEINLQLCTDGANVEEADKFFNSINRGGLKKPSYVMLLLCSHIYSLLSFVFNAEEIISSLLSMSNPKMVFIRTDKELFFSSQYMTWFNEVCCCQNHSIGSYYVNVCSIF